MVESTNLICNFLDQYGECKAEHLRVIFTSSKPFNAKKVPFSSCWYNVENLWMKFWITEPEVVILYTLLLFRAFYYFLEVSLPKIFLLSSNNLKSNTH